MKKTLMLWLLLIAGVALLSVWIIRPPAWAGPQNASRFSAETAALPEVHVDQIVGEAPTIATSATHLEFQADTPSSENCIACHTDKKKLKKLAKEPEEVKSEAASGEG